MASSRITEAVTLEWDRAGLGRPERPVGNRIITDWGIVR